MDTITITDKLIEVLETFGFPVNLQGSYQPGQAYPKSFFTFWSSTTDGNHYDNQAITTVWDFDVNFYSDEPEIVIATILAAKEKLQQAGFIVSGKGNDLASDEPSHTGKGLDVLYIEQNK